MSNREAVELVASTPDCMAATHLVNVAASRWKQMKPNSKQDDVSATIMYLHREVADQLASLLKGGDEVGCVGSLSDSFQTTDEDVETVSGISRPDVVFNDEGQRLESMPDSAFDDARCHPNDENRSMLQGTLGDDMHFVVEV